MHRLTKALSVLAALLTFSFAFTFAGCSIEDTTEQTYYPVSDLTVNGGYKKADLSWTNPEAEDISSLQIKYGTDEADPEKTLTCSKSTTSITISYLENGTKYYFTVYTIYKDGTKKDASQSATTVTPEAVSDLKAEAAGTSSIKLTWTNQSGDFYKSKKILYGTDSTSLTKSIAVSDNTAASYEITGLTAGTIYYFKVDTVLSDGDTVDSAVVSAATEEEVKENESTGTSGGDTTGGSTTDGGTTGGSTTDGGTTGGDSGTTGGDSTGGSTTGSGSTTGGDSTGGSTTGGGTSGGGTSGGGSTTGGDSTGGSTTGGSTTGDSGTTTGGSTSGGSTTGGDDDSGNTDDGSSSGGEAASTVDCEITASDFGIEWDWNCKVYIAASKFADMVSGDYITFTTEASSSSATYYQIGLQSGSTYLGADSDDSFVNMGSYNSTYHVLSLSAAAQDAKLYPGDTEIAALKANGLTITGYGVKLTKVTIRINANLDKSDTDTEVTDASATENTQKVMAYLSSIYGEKMLTGVMDCSWKSNTADDPIDMEAKVYNNTGKYPALVGYDFSFLLKSDSKTWCNPTQVEEAETAWNKGSLVTFCWHWLDPTATSGNGASYAPDEMGFRIPYDESTGKLDESSTNFTYIKNDLDTVASYLLQLQNDGVVVIWRPLHEAKGNLGGGWDGACAWFWWGAGNSTTYDSDTGKYSVSTDEDLCAASYKALWKYMYTYFTETKGLHNLIWLWNGQGAKWYPGDDYCDIVGYDIYDNDNANGAGQSYYNNLMSWCNSSKMATISECGYVPSTTAVQASTAKWLYYMVWNDDDALADDTSDDNDNFWGGTAYNSTAAKTTNSYSTDFTVKRGDTDLNALFTSMGVTVTQ